MRRSSALVLLVVLALVTALPAAVLGARVGPDPSAGSTTFDTPAPTPRPTERPRRTPRPDATRRPDRTPRPEPTPAPALVPELLPPARSALTVGLREPGFGGQAPLALALESGYFADAGLTEVTLVEPLDTLEGLRSGDVDIAVVDARIAAAAAAEDPSLQLIAGHRNYPGTAALFGGDVLLAGPGLVDREPTTIVAFLSAYIRALRDLADPASLPDALETLESAGLTLDPDADPSAAREAFAPFDGGFGSPEDDRGLGELSTWLEAPDGSVPDLEALIAGHTLTIAQAALELPANPAYGLTDGPGRTRIRVGLPVGVATSPVLAAKEAGYLSEAGFEAVEMAEVEEPLLGVLTGELDFGILDAVQAADGVAQGLPLVALAGHRNRSATDGAYGGDVLVASADLVADDPATTAAFLVAYLRGLRDLAGDAPEFAPHDGGFGSLAEGDGLGELRAYLESALGATPDLASLIERRPLAFAQAWWGLPANPTTAAVAAEPEGGP